MRRVRAIFWGEEGKTRRGGGCNRTGRGWGRRGWGRDGDGDGDGDGRDGDGGDGEGMGTGTGTEGLGTGTEGWGQRGRREKENPSPARAIPNAPVPAPSSNTPGRPPLATQRRSIGATASASDLTAGPHTTPASFRRCPSTRNVRVFPSTTVSSAAAALFPSAFFVSTPPLIVRVVPLWYRCTERCTRRTRALLRV
jgi:hypothetical protein